MSVAERLDAAINAVSPAWGNRRARARAVRRYEAAVQGTISKWHANLEAADDELPWADRRSLLANIRELLQNDPHARGAIEYRVNNVVGSGIQVKPKVLPDDPKVSLQGKPRITKAVADRFNAEMDVAWSRFRRTIDISGRLDFTRMLRLAERRIAADGESLAHFVKRERPAPFSTAVEILDADCLETPIGQSEDIRDGVQLDANGAPVAYWVKPYHPTDMSAAAYAKAAPIPAEKILHCYEVLRPGQTRGIPWLAPIAPLLRRKKKYAELEILAAIINSMYCGFIKTPDPYTTQVGDRTSTTSDGTPLKEMKAGAVHYLRDGEDVTFGNPTHPNETYEPYIRALLQEGAAGLSLAYESFSADTMHSTWTSMRAKLLAERDAVWGVRQMAISCDFCKPVYRRAADEALIRGMVSVEPALYMARRADFQRCVVRPPGWSWVDPEAEIAAALAAIQGKLLTYEDWFAGRGKDWEEQANQHEIEAQTPGLSMPQEAEDSVPVRRPEGKDAKNNGQGKSAGRDIRSLVRA